MQIAVKALTRTVLAILLMVLPEAAMAYTGPGLGLGAIGAALGIVGAVFLGLLSIIWYPVKRVWRKLVKKQDREP
jgi:Na+-driven multidrug efflux pump